MNFPRPVKIGPNATRWRLSDLLKWEAADLGGPPPTFTSADEIYLRDTQVAARYNVHRVTIWHWSAPTNDEDAA